MTKCESCGESIQVEHSEVELQYCLLRATNYIHDLNILVNKVLVLNGAGTKYKDGGYYHK